MLSPEGFDIAWTQYQGYIVDKLDRLTAGTDQNRKTYEPHSTKSDISLKVPPTRTA